MHDLVNWCAVFATDIVPELNPHLAFESVVFDSCVQEKLVIHLYSASPSPQFALYMGRVGQRVKALYATEQCLL